MRVQWHHATSPKQDQVKKCTIILHKAAGDNSGTSVSLSSEGKRVAIGAVFNEGNGYRSGNVRVYSL